MWGSHLFPRRIRFCGVLLVLCPALGAQDQPPPPTAGKNLDHLVLHSATGLALPNVPIDASLELKADKATSWRDGVANMVLLDREADVAIGAYFFHAERAVVMVTPRMLGGLEVRDVAIYLDRVGSIGGSRTTTAQAQRLLVTAVLRGAVRLETNLMVHESADSDELVVAAKSRIRKYFDAIAHNTAPVPAGPPLIDPSRLAARQQRRQDIEAQRAPAPPPAPPPGREPGKPALPQAKAAPAPADLASARVSFRAKKIVAEKNQDKTEARVLVMGDISLMFPDPRTGNIVSLRSDNAVIFLDPQALDDAAGRSLSIQNVRGVYLEGNVIATDGTFTFRGQRVFYDLKTDRAVVLDAVFYAWDPTHQVPLYVRAEHLRQHSRSQWSAQEARFTTSEFGEPHFSIGVGSLTITRNEVGAGGAGGGSGGGAGVGAGTFHFDAKDVTLRAGEAPFFYWPGMSGDPTQAPLRRISAGYSGRRGAQVETRWDLFALLDKNAPQGVDASLLVDGYSRRGPAVGIASDYDVESAFGELKAYYLHDWGADEPGGRKEVDPSTEDRGRVSWRHRHELPDNWEATIELGWISDPNFLEEFYKNDAMTDKEYESVVYLKQQREDWAFTFLVKHDFMDFIPTTDLLQTRGNIGGPDIGYTTEKMPEIEYYRIATPLWDNRLTWYSENRGSVMWLNLPRDTPRQRGFSRAQATALLGMMNVDRRFDAKLRDNGLDDDYRLRGDTRQEIQAPLALGPVNVTPYAAGRITAYDRDFVKYSGKDDEERFWGSVGTKFSTAISQTYPGVESDLFDVHKLRHVMEPSAHVFLAGTTIKQEEMPVYDYDVESLSEGGQLRVGVRNTLQTQRGGEGRWRSVDWIRIDSDIILNTDETQRESPIAQFFDYRPEHSLVGDHLWNQITWQATEAMAAVGDVNYSLEDHNVQRWTVGLIMDHTPRFTSFLQYREIEALDVAAPHTSPLNTRIDNILERAAYVRYGFEYILTPKYDIGFAHSYDVERGRDRDLSVSVTRRLPRWLLVVTVDFDRIEDQTSAGVALIPEGFAGRGSPGRNPFLFDRD